ncbi:MAG: glycosyltransferase family 2 protein, partial [Luminiphilus sp.]|nr:glycosyltransferase family 2 protein [Luminiphilus sp.]
ALTLTCVESVKASIHALGNSASVKIIVVDNGSSPSLAKNTPKLALSQDITMVRSEENLGFAGGMNLGIQNAQQGRVDAVWLLNNDIVVDREALPALVNFKKKHPDKILVGSAVATSVNGDLVTTYGYTYYKYLGVARPARSRGSHSSELPSLFDTRIDYLDGAAMFIDMAKLTAIGGLPTENFLYYEELNLTHALGGCIYVDICRASKVIHTGGASTAAMGNKKKTYFSSLAAFRYTKRHATLGLPLVVLLRFITALTRDIRGRTLDHMAAVSMALGDLLKNDCR